jgi:hypothetical protein
MSEEISKHSNSYNAICEALLPIFEWLDNAVSVTAVLQLQAINCNACQLQLQECLPKEIQAVCEFASVLPAGAGSPAFPFGGFVINFNVCTKIHRDWKDKGFCVVLVISEHCQGGDLCLEEAGIRLSLATGDAIAFASSDISHFNMHYKGERVSIVFHTDSAGEAWVKNRNYWDHSLFMLRSDNMEEQI